MKTACLFVLLAIAGCATPQQRAERMIAKYGPACDALGYGRQTDGWRNCVVSMYQADMQRAGVAAANVANVQRAIQQHPLMCNASGCR